MNGKGDVKTVENTEKQGKIYKKAYHETKVHSDIMFAYNVYLCTIPQDFPFVPFHWQDGFELIYIKRGRGLVQIEFETYEANQGDIFIVLPGQPHGIRQFEDMRMEYENIIFDANFLGNDVLDICRQKYLQPLLGGELCFPVKIGAGHECYEKVSGFLDMADQLCDKRPKGYEFGVKGAIQLFFSELFAMATEKEESAPEKKSIQRMKLVLTYMEEHYEKGISVEEMAKVCGYSASHFMRWFKQMTGMGFGQYFIEFRLEKAAVRLRTSEDGVLEISEQTGFHNLSNFNRLFKKKYKCTPLKFRKKLLQNDN